MTDHPSDDFADASSKGADSAATPGRSGQERLQTLVQQVLYPANEIIAALTDAKARSFYKAKTDAMALRSERFANAFKKQPRTAIAQHCDESSEISEKLMLIAQALALAAPLADYELAANQQGWQLAAWEAQGLINEMDGSAAAASRDDSPGPSRAAYCFVHHSGERLSLPPYHALCTMLNIAPALRPIKSFYAVNKRLAVQLLGIGERVEMQFAGSPIWARISNAANLEEDQVLLKLAGLI